MYVSLLTRVIKTTTRLGRQADLTRLQLLVGGQQSLGYGRRDQLGHKLRTETLSSDKGLGLPEAVWLLQQQQLLQNRTWFLFADLSEGTLQLLGGQTDNMFKERQHSLKCSGG